jgi:hypothetical protein
MLRNFRDGHILAISLVFGGSTGHLLTRSTPGSKIENAEPSDLVHTSAA